MIIKDTIKSLFIAKNKILAMGFFIFILFGVFGYTHKVNAQVAVCEIYQGEKIIYARSDITKETCLGPDVLGNKSKVPTEILPYVTVKFGGEVIKSPDNTGTPPPTEKPPGERTEYQKCLDRGASSNECDKLNLSGAPNGECVTVENGITTRAQTTRIDCAKAIKPGLVASWNGQSLTAADATNGASNGKDPLTAQSSGSDKDLFGVCTLTKWSVSGCLVSISYYIFLTLPSYILYVTAYIFNEMLALSLGTVLYRNNFLPEAWRIVRDFSNIFFILVLLYVAIKMILGLGGSDIKKMITSVIISALLINFSMFMTQVVIDSANILALIFYNKISVTSAPFGSNKTGEVTNSANDKTLENGESNYKSLITAKNGVTSKDIAGGIATAFNPTKFINPSLAAKLNDKLPKPTTGSAIGGTLAGCAAGTALGPAGTVGGCILGYYLSKGSESNGELPVGIALAIIFTGCAVYLFAAYAFFVAGLAFVARLIELWVLIIFSPFAFMSLSVPQLQGVDYLGWNAWSKRLVTTASMAPIFMFFLLLISKLVQIDILHGIYNEAAGASIPLVLVTLTIPALIYITMLYKATEFAKKGAGEIGETVIKYGKMVGAAVGGIAIGAATGGAGVLAAGTLGRAGSALAKSGALASAEEKGGLGGFIAGRIRDAGKYAGKSSFDLRRVSAVGNLMKSAGMKTESSTITKAIGLGTREGGFEQRKKERDEYRRNRSNELKEIASKGEQKKVRELEAAHQNLLEQNGNAHLIEQVQNQLKMAEVYRSDAAAELRADPTNLAKKARAKETSEAVKELRDQRSAIKNGTLFFKESTQELIDYREQTVGMDKNGKLDVELNGSLSENALKGIATAAQKAEDAAKADPGNTSLANTAKIARAAHYAALATQAQEDADKAQAEADKNPTDAILKAKAATAKSRAATAKSLAVMDQGIVAGLTAAAGSTAAEIESLAKAKDAALRAVDKIKNGLAGRAINNLEDTDMPEAKHAVHHTERASARRYVKNNLETDTSTFGGKVTKVARFIAAPVTGDSEKARARTAHDITMNNKLDSGTGGKGGGH